MHAELLFTTHSQVLKQRRNETVQVYTCSEKTVDGQQQSQNIKKIAF